MKKVYKTELQVYETEHVETVANHFWLGVCAERLALIEELFAQVDLTKSHSPEETAYLESVKAIWCALATELGR